MVLLLQLILTNLKQGPADGSVIVASGDQSGIPNESTDTIVDMFGAIEEIIMVRSLKHDMYTTSNFQMGKDALTSVKQVQTIYQKELWCGGYQICLTLCKRS